MMFEIRKFYRFKIDDMGGGYEHFSAMVVEEELPLLKLQEAGAESGDTFIFNTASHTFISAKPQL